MSKGRGGKKDPPQKTEEITGNNYHIATNKKLSKNMIIGKMETQMRMQKIAGHERKTRTGGSI